MENLRIFTAVIFTFYLVGCSSSDDSGTGESEPERTKIVMKTPNGNEDVDWSTAELVFDEEFDGTTKVEDFWNFEMNSEGSGDADQLQTYSKKNVEISNGTLKIYARKVGEGQAKGDYTSARINGKYAFQYGRIEVKAKLPAAEKNGLWAKISLIGSNIDLVGYPQSGEINLMEYLSYRPNEIYIIVHSSANDSANDPVNGPLIVAYKELETAEEEFHIYGLLWTNKYLKFYIDDPNNIIYTFHRPVVASEENWPFDQPFFLVADLVVGGQYGGVEGVDDSMFPATVEIDYIRVYHPE